MEGLKVGWRTTQRSARTGRCHDAALVFQLCLREGKVKCKVKKCEMWKVAVFLRGYKILITLIYKVVLIFTLKVI